MAYDTIIVAFSGGKDSTACYLHLKELGIPNSKIELHHHLVDGVGKTLFDWEITEDYCRKFAEAFGVKIYFSWKEGGILQEMLRDQVPTKPTVWEDPSGKYLKAGGDSSKVKTVMMFPQVGKINAGRWCSAYVKIDVFKKIVGRSPRFENKKILVLTGERAEESQAREKYEWFTKHDKDQREELTPTGKKRSSVRHIDQYRPVHSWLTDEIWGIIERNKVRSHPAYYGGFGRVSCQFCIFGNKDQFKSAEVVSPDRFQELVNLERHFSEFHNRPVTMKRKMTLEELIKNGSKYEALTPEVQKLLNSEEYDLDIIFNGTEWEEPAGKFGNLKGGAT